MANLVEVAVGAGSFTTLVAAVQAAGLVETLSGKGPFTVFAPNDAAFAKLPKGTVESLLKDIPKLTSILTYHVVAGKVMAADVVKLTSAKTVQGQSVTIDTKNGVSDQRRQGADHGHRGRQRRDSRDRQRHSPQVVFSRPSRRCGRSSATAGSFPASSRRRFP